jgi:molybdopterin-guanine dinucleotide biosynthesis protein A
MKYTWLVAQDIQAYLLTGGLSTRMGRDKASLLVNGVPVARRIALSLQEAGYPVVVLGREPIPPFEFQKDREANQGPLKTLADVYPDAPKFFAVSCDLPRFDARIVEVLNKKLDSYDTAVPCLRGEAQPLCALYRTEALEVARSLISRGERKMKEWLRHLHVREVSEEEILSEGLTLECLENANTPEDWERLMGAPPFASREERMG